MNTIKISLAMGCTFAIPFLNPNDSILPVSTSLKLLRIALGSMVAYRACIYWQKPFHIHKISAEDNFINKIYQKWTIVNEIFEGYVADLADLTLITSINLAYPYFLVHESGHYVCAKLFFLEGNGRLYIPHSMNITSFCSGKTRYTVSFGLTKIGQYLGKKVALKITMAGGMIASTLYSCVNIVLSKALIQKIHLSHFLFLLACSQSIQEFIYQSGFFLSQIPTTSHDLSQLQNHFQINPFCPIVAIAIAPIITFWMSS